MVMFLRPMQLAVVFLQQLYSVIAKKQYVSYMRKQCHGMSRAWKVDKESILELLKFLE